MKEITEHFLEFITFLIGLVGIIVILIGTVDALLLYIKKKRDFQKIRYVIGKHILVGLDFLVVKDIIETVFLEGSNVHVMDLVLLVIIVGIRMLLTTHTSKGVQDMREQMEFTKIRTKHIEESLEHLEDDEKDLEKRFVELEKEELESQRREMLLEQKLDEIQKLMKK